MAPINEKLSSAESLRAGRTYKKIRCMNPSCLERLEPQPGSEHIKCGTCGLEYRLFWVRPDLPRIRGPVWDVNRKIAAEVLEKKLAAKAAAAKKTEE